MPTLKDDETARVVPIDPKEDGQVPNLTSRDVGRISAVSSSPARFVPGETDLMTMPETIKPPWPSTLRPMSRVKAQPYDIRHPRRSHRSCTSEDENEDERLVRATGKSSESEGMTQREATHRRI